MCNTWFHFYFLLASSLCIPYSPLCIHFHILLFYKMNMLYLLAIAYSETR